MLTIFSSIFIFASGYPKLAFLLFTFALLSFLFFLSIKSRIEFASANIKVACSALLTMESYLFLYGCVIAAVLVFFVLLWGVAVYGIATNEAVSQLRYAGEVFSLRECVSYKFYDVSEDVHMRDV